MRVRLAYGRDGLDVELPDEHVVTELVYQPAPPLEHPAAELRRLLQEPQGTPSLAELARGKRTACILICDITRPVPNELLLTPMLESLAEAGIPDERICILIATGLHRGNTPAEIREMVGPSIQARYRIENHDGQDSSQHVDLGMSPNGVPIQIDRRYVEADLKIATGLIEPHLMAGYSGGRKLICPGIASLETVRSWHSPRFLEDPRAICGVLEGNPVHQENTWIARHVGCDFIVNIVIDAQRQPLKLVAGDLEEAFLEGVEFVRHIVRGEVTQPVDVVVTSSAGYPLDTTFYQSVKGMTGAMPIVKPGGTIILAASMTEGIGSAPFQQLFEEHASLDAFMQRIQDPDYFCLDQWQLEKMAHACQRARVQVYTDGLAPEVINRLFVESVPSVEQAVASAVDRYGPETSIAVIPKGPYVLAEVAAAG